MKLKSLLVGAVAGLLLTACGGGASPEDVTKSFVEALAAGNCDKAKEMAVDNALTTVESTAESGCAEYTTEIKSVECDEPSEDAVTCKCVENRDMGEMTYSYDLKKVDGAWKVSNYSKEMGGDGGMNLEGLGG
jgi:hypothetical protein